MTFDHFFIVFIIAFAVFILEWIFSGFWIEKYYIIGIPLFKKEIELFDSCKTSKITDIVTSFGTEKDFRNLKGKIINENLLYFRYRMDKKNTGFLHGCIKIDPESKSITLKGFLGISEILFPILLVLLHICYFKELGFFSPYLFSYLVLLLNIGLEIWEYKKISNKILEKLKE